MAAALGWEDCIELDNAIALNPFIDVRLPGGFAMRGHEICRQIDFGKPRTSSKDNLIILARTNVFDWWVG